MEKSVVFKVCLNYSFLEQKILSLYFLMDLGPNLQEKI
jgi:hypothetical protein